MMRIGLRCVGIGLASAACVSVSTACNGTLDNLGGNSDSGSSAVSALPDGVLATDIVMSLSDTQAASVCTWLTAKFRVPWPEAMPSSNPPVNGYENGPSTGCTTTPPLGWVLLDQQDCILNLRYSPCPATIGALAQCLDAIQPAAPSSSSLVSCSEGCAAFEASPLCDQTVIQGIYSPHDDVCSGLPIDPAATCPVSLSGADAGPDAD